MEILYVIMNIVTIGLMLDVVLGRARHRVPVHVLVAAWMLVVLTTILLFHNLWQLFNGEEQWHEPRTTHHEPRGAIAPLGYLTAGTFSLIATRSPA
jgi:NADH:ubiquinone oxidoreductase subunit 5 (subunit L)/multisubunit Na+/H+ antiporter MnhA subunit